MKKSLIILSAIALLACNQTAKNNSSTLKREEIIQITYTNAGGDMGFSEILEITADSLNYSYLIAAENNKSGQYDTLTTNELWSQLLTACDLTVFAKIKSGRSYQPEDGTDQTFTILTTTRTLSFMNGRGRKYDRFLDIIQRQAWESNNKCTEQRPMPTKKILKN